MVRHHPLLPMAAAACGIATFSVMDAAMKAAAIDSGVFATLMWRGFVGAAMASLLWAPQVWRQGWPPRGRIGLHLARSVVSTGMAFLFFWGLVRTPMAVAMALSFFAPLIALYLAAAFLGESVTRRALLASLIGLAGVVVIALGRLHEPVAAGAGLSAWDSAMGIAAIFGSAMLYAGNLVMQRHQAQVASPAEITFFQGAFIGLLLSPGALWLPAWPSAQAWPLVVAGAGLGTVSLLLLSWGWARAPAHRLLPVEYTGFLWAAAAGWLWFAEPVSGATLAGVGLILIGVWHGAGGRDHAGVDLGDGPPPTLAPETEATAR
ncbi:EamA family transporter [Novosphingobium sp. FSY-8]|uniref:EamA family transporter n=1 Tax=Novosphingobium ovatum TaxID=1908523 RepID=A0ABW9XGF4_9SPHN|nr:DMT family transporter [Novosphingobium ovatum]NBC37571.1 EamA family transporter [Novosphingobium ovatum]